MLKDLVLANRSYRGYDQSRRVTKEELLQMVDCARLTPSTFNGQPFKYYLAFEKETVDKIQPLTKWAKALADIKLPHQGMCPTAFIVICQDTKIGESISLYQKDVGIVAQTILLKATENGLGGCMIGNFNALEVRNALCFAENIVPVMIIAIGKPKENVIITDVLADGKTNYYRDGNDNHYVPKRRLEDILL